MAREMDSMKIECTYIVLGRTGSCPRQRQHTDNSNPEHFHSPADSDTDSTVDLLDQVHRRHSCPDRHRCGLEEVDRLVLARWTSEHSVVTVAD